MDSVLKESILLQSVDYKNNIQNNLLKRFLFKSGVDNDKSIPYNLVTKNIASLFYKREANQQVKIAILNAELMDINVNDIIYKLKNYRISKIQNNENINDHYPFDTKISILDFYTLTGKFINVYQVLDDNSLKKIDPLKVYKYQGNEVGLCIEIKGTNSINIEFYDDGKVSNYVVEMISCLSKYSQVSFSDYQYKENTLTFVNGIIVPSDDIQFTNLKIEVYEFPEKNIIYNGLVNVNNNKEIVIDTEYMITDPSLIIPYAYVNGNNTSYKQYLNPLDKFYDYIPNSFKNNYDADSIHIFVLGNKEFYSTTDDDIDFSDHKLLSETLVDIYKNNPSKEAQERYNDLVNDLIKNTFEQEDDNGKLLLKYPYYYREVLEKVAMKDLYIDTLYKFPIDQIETVDDKKCIKFTFPIRSFSFILFKDGKVISPYKYEETKLDITIYVSLEEQDEISSDYVVLDSPITVVRAKSFFREDECHMINLDLSGETAKGIVPYNKYLDNENNLTFSMNGKIYKKGIYSRTQADSGLEKVSEPVKELNEEIDVDFPKNDFIANSTIILHDSDIGYSKYYTSNDDNEYSIPTSMRFNNEQVMLFRDGKLENDFILNDTVYPTVSFLTPSESHTTNDIFITDMPKILPYQTIEDMTLYSNMTIEISDCFHDTFAKDYTNGRQRFRKNLNLVHYPLSLKYMMIFVNGLYMDENHVEILSNRRFMLKNLSDYFNDTIPLEELPEYKNIRAFKNTTFYNRNKIDEDEKNNERAFKIHSIDIYMYPFKYNEEYNDYYKDIYEYRDENDRLKYKEYILSDKLYDTYFSDIVSSGAGKCDDVVFVNDNGETLPFEKYHAHLFMHVSLANFKHNYVLRRFEYDDIERINVMSDYTQNYFNHNFKYIDLIRWIHGPSKNNHDIKRKIMALYSHDDLESNSHNELENYIHDE